MIDLRREAAVTVCERAGLPFVTDPSNTDERFTRNRIRRELRERGEEHLLGLVELGRRNAESVTDVDREVEALLADIATERDDLIVLDATRLEHLPETTARAVLRRAMTNWDPEPTSPSLARALDVAANGGRASLGADVHIWREGESVFMGAWPQRVELPELVLPVPGHIVSGQWGWEFRSRADYPSYPVVIRPRTERFDADALEDVVTVRQWRPGDRMTPLGLSGSKKLQDLFTDLKIPRRERDRVPVIESGGEIVWVVPFRIAEPFKVTAATRRVMTITAIREA
ncbi:MAG TPA: tRNA lysidine(34) synthetase TilS, partial [Actinomycetota bacterium]|nr:tRNA lysidine(34) synthetase TilS [Actinomycetota bacterium]